MCQYTSLLCLIIFSEFTYHYLLLYYVGAKFIRGTIIINPNKVEILSDKYVYSDIRLRYKIKNFHFYYLQYN